MITSKSSVKIIVLLIVLLVTGFVLVREKKNNSKENETIKIGAIVFLSGPQSLLGEEVKNALILANELDDNQKDKQISLVFEDSQDDPNKAIGAYNKLRSEGVSIFIATGDQIGYALAPIAERDRSLLFMTVAASQEISGRYVFRGWITAEQQGAIMGDYTSRDLAIKKLGIITINNIYGESSTKAFEKKAKENGAEVVGSEMYGITDTDMKTQLLKIINKSPGTIIVDGFGTAYPVIFKQLRELGWKKPIMTNTGLAVPFFFSAVGIQNLNDTYFISTNFDTENPKNETMLKFVSEYKTKFGAEPDFIGAFAFDSYTILADVIRSCGRESDAVRECLVNLKDKEGMLGSTHFSNHEMKIPLLVKKVENNTIVTKKVISN